jgi:hypothetical protein
MKSPSRKRQKVHHHHHRVEPVATDTAASFTKSKSDKGHERSSKSGKVKKRKVKAVCARNVLFAENEFPGSSGFGGAGGRPKVSRQPYIPELSSEEEEVGEVDVITPDVGTTTSLSVSLKKSLLALNDLSGPYMVSISRGTLSKPASGRSKPRNAGLAGSMSKPETSVPTMPDGDSGTSQYRVEFDGTSTKMIFRSEGAAGGVVGEAVGGAAKGVVKEKKAKSKKKKKKKSKLKDLEASQDIHGSRQDTITPHHGTVKAACQDIAGSHQDTGVARQDTDDGTTGNVLYTDSLKVKIKL